MILSVRSSIRSIAMRRGRARPAGLRTLEDVREVAIVAVPDIHIQPKAAPRSARRRPASPIRACRSARRRWPARGRRRWAICRRVFPEGAIYQVQAALMQHCEKLRDRLALLDPPFSAARDDKLGVGAVRAWRSRFDSKYAAFYYPWLRVVDPLRSPHFAHAGDSAERPCGRTIRANRLSIRRAQGAGQRAAPMGPGCHRLRRRCRARHSQPRRASMRSGPCRAAVCASLARAP